MVSSGLKNKAIGQAGEFAVCAQLGKMGLVATPFAGNVPEFDVIAVDGQLNCLPIQVKTTMSSSGWIAGAFEKYCEIEYDDERGVKTVVGRVEPSNPDLIMVYAWLSRNPGFADRFFLIEKGELWRLMHDGLKAWLEAKGGKHGKHTSLTTIAVKDLVAYEDNWELVRRRLAQMAEERPRH